MAQLTQELSGPVGAVSPSQPVPNPGSGTSVGQGLNFLAGLIGDVGKGFQNAKQAEAQTQANIDVVSFLDSQASIADALERGDITSSQARSRMRDNFRRAAAANPNVYGELLEANGKFMSQRGLGKVVEDEVDRFQAAEKEALNAGWSKIDFTPEQRREATLAWLDFQAELATMEVNKKRLEFEREQIGLTSATIDLNQKVRGEKARVSLGRLNQSFLTKFRLDQQDVLNRFQAGTLSAEEAEAALNNNMRTVEGFIRDMGVDAGGDFVSNILATYTNANEDARKVLTGETSLQVYQNQLTKRIAIEALAASGDPDMLKAAALDRLLPNSNIATLQVVTHGATRYLNSNRTTEGKPAYLFDVKSEQGRADVGLYADTILDNMKEAVKGAIDAPTQEQLRDNVVNILRGIDVYQSAIDSPEDFQGLLKLLSSSEFGSFMKKEGTIDPSVAENARNVFKQQYHDVAQNLIRDEYQSRTEQITAGVFGLGAERAPLDELVRPVFNGSGVVFEVSEAGSVASIGFNRNQRVKLEANRLNKDLSPILNRLVRIGAHLQGNTDYKRVYEEQVSSIFTGESPRALDTGGVTPQGAGKKAVPKVGDVVNGMKFKGGNPWEASSWEEI